MTDPLRAAVAEMFTDPVTGKPTSGWFCTNEIADRIRAALAADTDACCGHTTSCPLCGKVIFCGEDRP